MPSVYSMPVAVVAGLCYAIVLHPCHAPLQYTERSFRESSRLGLRIVAFRKEEMKIRDESQAILTDHMVLLCEIPLEIHC